MVWKTKMIYSYPKFKRYEITNGTYTIDVNSSKPQGFAGSNMVNIYSKKYGGTLLGTPKGFKTKAQVIAFIKKAKASLNKGLTGKKVPFRRK